MSGARKSIVWKLVLPVPIVLLVAILAVWIFVPRIVENSAREIAVTSAIDTASQLNILRSYYTRNVAEKVIADGNLSLSSDHKNEPKSVPLPATVIHDLSALFEEDQTKVQLYSAYPFPNRSTRVLDDFQQDAWDILTAEPDRVFSRQETRDGMEVVRVAIADRMVAETCTGCHNSRADTPKADWKIGDVRGVLEVTIAIGEQLAVGASISNIIVIAAVLGGSLLIAISTFIARGVTAPLIRITHAMDRLSEGGVDVDVPEQGRGDEIGVMARSLEVFKGYAARISESKAVLGRQIRVRETYERKLEAAQVTLEQNVAVQTRELNEEIARRKQIQDQLSEAVENMSEGFVIYDADDRLVLCNSRNREFYADSADLFVTGTHIEEILRAGIERGQYVETTGEAEEWIAWRLARFHNPSGVFVEKLSSGKWIQISEHKTSNGRTICVRTDITDLKSREKELLESETKIRSILDNTADSIITFDDRGAVETFNGEAERCFGYSIDEIAGRSIATLITDYAADHNDGDLEQYLADDHGRVNGVRREVSCQRKNGTTFPADLAVSGLQLGERNIFVGIFKDITQRRLTEAALIESQQRLSAIADNLFESVLVVDPDGHIIFSNRAANILLGFPGGAIAGRDMDDVFWLRQGRNDVRFADSPFHQVAAVGAIENSHEAVFVIEGGNTLDVAFACAPLLEDGKPRGAIISFRDIRELKEVQKEMLQASKLASVGQLAAGIAHEINTPAQYIGDNLRFLSKSHEDIMTVLDAYAELAVEIEKLQLLSDQVAKVNVAIEESDLTFLLEEIPAATEQSLGGIDQVSRIVLAMKEFSHPGTGQKTATDLNRAIENTLTVCRSEWKDIAEADLRLNQDLPLVTCRPGQMNQVLLNLIVNAAHAITAFGAQEKGRITIETRRDGDWVEIEIADTGGGIPEEIRDQIFDPFFTTKEVGKGTGQGLAICRDVIVDKHGGKIMVEPGVDTGTVFVLRLPIDGQAHGPSRESAAA